MPEVNLVILSKSNKGFFLIEKFSGITDGNQEDIVMNSQLIVWQILRCFLL